MIPGSTSAFIFIQIALAQVDRRDRHFLELGRLGVAGDVVEDARHVASDHGVRREERQVCVNARGDRVIIAGAGVNVGRQRSALAAHHQ
jgi:hypothetical protein